MDEHRDVIGALREAVSAQPDNLRLRLLLAEALLGAGGLDDAEAEFRAALSQLPRNDRAQLGLARVYLERGRLEEAELLVEDVLESGETAQAVLMRCRLKLARGRLRDAAEDYAEAVELDAGVADEQLAERLTAYMGEPDEPEPPVRADEIPDGGPIDLLMPLERPDMRFDDIGGMEAMKDAIRMMIIAPLEQPELYAAYGKAAGGGILLYGPPGCGKTHLARATAGQINASFLNIGLNDVLDMWLGNSERRLHAIFEQARRSRPCVLFFDEVDALGGSRGSHAGAGRNVVNQFLSEMDGLAGRNDGVLVLAATNAPWHVDPAFRRPGRFDRVLFVPPPDEPSRAAIIQILVAGKPVEGLDVDALVKRTTDFSGADLRAVVDRAIEAKLRDAMRTGTPRPITTSDLLQAADHVRPTTGEWFAAARNYAVHANQTGAYDEVAAYLRIR